MRSSASARLHSAEYDDTPRAAAALSSVGCFSNELLRFNMAGFVEMHRGYLFKEIISPQHHTAEHLAFVLGTGGRLWDPETGDYTLPLRSDPAELIRKPHIIGVTRDMVDRRDRAASWVGSVFDYHSPILRFSPSEQRLLTCALTGVTDEQLAGALGISVSGVKKMWISIHRRVEESMPDLIPESHSLEVPTNSRGKEKCRRLLAYLRDHPEELRPASRLFSGVSIKSSTAPRCGSLA
jgi:hypothetical protein